MNIFISYNNADKDIAKNLAENLTIYGSNVWFDEWRIRPGDSIIGGISYGLENAEAFILLWSSNSANSKWVDTEIRSILRKRVDETNLRLIPIMLDNTKLPIMFADYSGFKMKNETVIGDIAKLILGIETNSEALRLIQKNLEESGEVPVISYHGYTYYCCPTCGSKNLQGGTHNDYENDRTYFEIYCTECKWREGGEI